MKIYRYTGETTDKFWRIETSGRIFAVNYGKIGSVGKYQLKEFENPGRCEKEAKKLIDSKVNKGYKPYSEFDLDAHFYFDDDEFGLHLLTSHPRFRAHFTDDFYYDCGDEEAPFGSDEGADTLVELEEYMRKNKNIDLCKFPRLVVEDMWELTYLPPDSLDENDVKAIIAAPEPDDDDELPMSQLVMITDRVIIAAALGQIKVMGKVDLRVKALALRALKRLLMVAEYLEFGYSEITKKMLDDLESFQNPPPAPPSETAKILIDYLDCPCSVFSDMLDDDDLIYSYEEALLAGKGEGYTPLIIVVDETLLEQVTLEVDDDSNMDFDRLKVKAYREKIISDAAALDPETVLKELGDELLDDEKAEVGPVRGGKPVERFSSFWKYDETDRSKEVILAKVPVKNPWELAAYVPMGGFNDCPSPEKQVAVMKYWYEKYGAIPGLVSYCEWEFSLNAPVTDKDEALKLANEQYYFCYDRVEQYEDGYTIGKLAHCLTLSKVWYFWWD